MMMMHAYIFLDGQTRNFQLKTLHIKTNIKKLCDIMWPRKDINTTDNNMQETWFS